MTQHSLFDPPCARHTDPATSHIAAADVPLGHLCSVFLQALSSDERTAAEVARRAFLDGLHDNVESVRKRAKQLVRLKRITELPPRQCTVTGKLATVYRAIETRKSAGM